MRIEALILGRDNGSCIDVDSCPNPSCSCPEDQRCVLISSSCTACSSYQCVSSSSSSSSGSGGVSPGAVAGAVVGSLVFLAIVVGVFLWYRRNQRRSAAAVVPEVKDIPAAAEDVLNRPDPMEKHYSTPAVPPPTEMNTVRRVYSTSSNSTIDLDPASQTPSNHTSRVPSNPFEDSQSIQTTGTEGTNVIPIALVAPESQSRRQSLSTSADETSRSTSPVRPARSPDLNLDHVNVSHDSFKPSPRYPTSTRSDVSGNTRNSYMSSASYSSDLLNEAPMIITPNKGAVRQVLGVVKAEMVNAPSHHTSTNSEGLKPTSKPVVRSPLAASSFGPADMSSDTASISLSEEGGNPFSDKHSTQTTMASSPAASHTTFGEQFTSDWTPSGPRAPWVKSDGDSRPSSVSTQAGSVIDIAQASRVNFGLSQFGSESGLPTPRTPHRTTMARLVTPSTGEITSFEQQQQRALAHAQAQAQAQGGVPGRRVSVSSAMSATADSILESFPFVPPSPISNRPARSPPVSPGAQQTFKVSPPSPLATETFSASTADPLKLGTAEPSMAPPNRKTLGMSTGSQLSTASTGLGSFPFQIDTGRDSTATSAFSGRQRASLDTLALTSDLSSFPLGFDRDSVNVPMPGRE